MTQPEWWQPLTVADEALIEGLDAATRAAVERYRRSVAPGLQMEPDEIRQLVSQLDSATFHLNEAQRAMRRRGL